MQPIQEKQDFPRFIKDFIGKGHELEEKKRQRKKVEQQERSLANRVLFLEKEEIRTQKSLQQKRQQLSRIMDIAERQAYEKQSKERQLLERMNQIDMAREQNRLRRIIHKQNQEQSVSTTLERNSLDYKITKRMIQQSERKKQLDKLEDLTSRKERYMTLNLMKEKGRSRVDKYFQKKNKEHTKLYQEKIMSEEEQTHQKLDTIKKLGEIEDVLRKKLEQTSLRVSQMEQIIGDVSSTVKKRSLSKTSFNLSASLHNSPTLITSIDRELLASKDEIDEKLEEGGEGGVSEGGKVRKRHRNKHINRYKEYQMF